MLGRVDLEVEKPMSKSKQYLQNQFKTWKAAAFRFISVSSAEHENMRVELDPHSYEMCKQIADLQQTTVQAVINHALEQFIASRSNELKSHATLEQKEKNPLLYLDALTKSMN